MIHCGDSDSVHSVLEDHKWFLSAPAKLFWKEQHLHWRRDLCCLPCASAADKWGCVC